VLQFLEKFTGVKEENISDWRRATFGDLVSAFRFDDNKAAPPQLPDAINECSRAKYEAGNLPDPPLPGAEQKLPTQEKGQRKRVPRK
jgi:phospholipase C